MEGLRYVGRMLKEGNVDGLECGFVMGCLIYVMMMLGDKVEIMVVGFGKGEEEGLGGVLWKWRGWGCFWVRGGVYGGING